MRVKLVYERENFIRHSYMKVIGSRSRSQEQKCPKSLSQYKTSISINSGSIKYRATKFACSMVFSDIADQVV